jgi:two-component system chemotaxis response regulator CheY
MAKIMVVDDAKVMREMISAMLVTEGHEVVCADDGDVGLEMARDEVFDMILSDINMPNMSGISMVSKIRILDGYQETPIIMLTTESSNYKKDKAKKMGANGWLQKPIEPKRLVKAVNTMLARAGHLLPSRD